MDPCSHLYIVGAGFSFNAGLPLATGFTRALLDPPTRLKAGYADAILNEAIQRFVNDALGMGRTVASKDWPALEDIFTTIDLAANTGHHLGTKYSASMLRTMRRVLIIRFMRMLREAYNDGLKAGSGDWRNLETFLEQVDVSKSAFLSLNWDTVIESGLTRTQRISRVDYGCDAIPVQFSSSGAVKHRMLRSSQDDLRLLKPHGSVNWMYCDCCSNMFWFEPKSTPKIASRLFKTSDSEAIKSLIGKSAGVIKTKAVCPKCKAEALGTRFATFSYRKALDFPMHLATWREAEHQLRIAKNWIFIGYSLPAADYEFKFLLKRVQLSRTNPPNVVVITSGGVNSETAKIYKKFFGAPAVPRSNLFPNGLNASALAHLQAIDALKA